MQIDRTGAVPIAVAAIVTAVVTVASALLPDRYVATVVGLLFFAPTWFFVWRRDDATVERAGLAFGGAVMPGVLNRARLGRETGRALVWAAVLVLLTFGPFYAGWRLWAHYVWHATTLRHARFVLALKPLDALNEIAGQIVIIALPEEVFYRGYLQSRLDEAWAPRWKVLGAAVGPALVVTSVIFALGHFATQRDPARLAVFFPSLVFGWLRARTGGVGAGIAFHAACNLFSEALMRGYGMH